MLANAHSNFGYYSWKKWANYVHIIMATTILKKARFFSLWNHVYWWVLKFKIFDAKEAQCAPSVQDGQRTSLKVLMRRIRRLFWDDASELGFTVWISHNARMLEAWKLVRQNSTTENIVSHQQLAFLRKFVSATETDCRNKKSHIGGQSKHRLPTTVYQAEYAKKMKKMWV